MRTDCPSTDELERFLLGELPDDHIDAIERHLAGGCADCERGLEGSRPSDPLLDAARQARAAPPPRHDEVTPALALTPAGDTADGRLARDECLDPPQRPDEIGRVGAYRVLSVLGRGGMGVVFQAHQPELDRVVALKMILENGAGDPERLRRFRGEAVTAARLRHPNIVQIHEVGEHRGRPFICMEYQPGGPLVERLSAAPLPPRQAADLLAVLARAVQHAHDAGVIHRDLKPANVLLDADGSPKIADFGLAKRLQAEEGDTRTGQVMGTPGYMAPEQALGSKGVGTAADVYALGAILYECLTGRPPFQGSGPLETLQQVLSADPVPPRRLQPACPRDLEVICLKCLEKAPGRRYAKASALADDLDAHRQGRPIRARPLGLAARIGRWGGRNPVAAALVLVSLVALVAVPAAVVVGVYNARLQESYDLAESAREAAVRAGERESQALAREQEEVRRTRELHYLHRVSLARAEWIDGRLLRMLDVLEECPADLRRWEWHYLRRLAQGDGTAVPLTAVPYVVAASPDRETLAVGCGDDSIVLLDVRTYKERRVVRGHLARVMGLAFSADGKRLLSAASDGTVRLWRVEDGHSLATFPLHPGGARSVAFSSDGRLAASAGKSGPVKVWRPDDGTVLRELSVPASQDHVIAFSPDGAWLAHGGSLALQLWSVPRPATDGDWAAHEVKGHTNKVRGLAWRPGAVLELASVDEDGVLKIWSLGQQATCRHSIEAHARKAYCVCYSPDGRLIATGGGDSLVKVWRAAGGEAQELHGHLDRVLALTFSTDGRRLISGANDRGLRVWSAGVDPGADAVGAESPGMAVAWSPDGARVATAGGRVAKVWSADGRRLLHAHPGHAGHARVIAFRCDSEVLATGDSGGVVRLFAASDGKLLRTIEAHRGAVTAISFSPMGLMATSGRDKAVRVWDERTGQQRREYLEHKADVRSLAFRPEGDLVASAGEDFLLRVWCPHTGETSAVALQQVQLCQALAWSPAGDEVAAAAVRQQVAIYAADGEQRRVLRGHLHGVNGVAWSPDGKRIATAGLDARTIVWDASTGQQALVLPGPGREVAGVTWSPDGRRLATIDRGGSLKVWDGTPLPEGDGPRRANPGTAPTGN